MKNFLTVFVFILAASSFVHAQSDVAPAPNETATAPANGPEMKFETEVMDYGTIVQGADPYRFFKFENTGTEALVIKHAKGSCGCTVPTYPKEPILPGETGEIKVRYDTNRIGAFTKKVTLTTNVGSENIVLTIKGKVEKKPEEPAGLPSNDNPFNNNN